MKKTDRIWLLSLILMMGATMMFTISCKDDEETPSLTTSAVSEITNNSASCGGVVTDEGTSDVMARGVCWNTSASPTVINCNTIDGAGKGNFVSSLTGLVANTTYYVRAYATNNEGTTYGNEITFITLEDETPSMTTSAISRITDNSASCSGEVTAGGTSEVTSRGVCWNTSASPTVANSHTIDGAGTGTFVSYLTDLDANTTYYVRAYATNDEGTNYGNELTFTTPPTVTDIDGNVYHSVIIGDQVWMAENLRVTHYRNGAQIQYIASDVPSNQEWMQCTTGAYCIAGTGKYGLLYNFYAVMDQRHLAPQGWHIPTDAEWKILEGTVDSKYPVGDPMWNAVNVPRGSDAGGNLKSTTKDWDQPNIGANDKFGFSALPGGYRSWPLNNGIFMEQGIAATFFADTLFSPSESSGRAIRFDDSYIYRPTGLLATGCSVRCIKD